jgi:hypothetical protein
LPIKRKDWEVAEGGSLEFSVQYRLKSPTSGELSVIPLPERTPFVSIRKNGSEVSRVLEGEGVEINPSLGEVSVNISPETVSVNGPKFSYYVFVAETENLQNLTALLRGTVAVV